jgi:hypothetical protein
VKHARQHRLGDLNRTNEVCGDDTLPFVTGLLGEPGDLTKVSGVIDKDVDWLGNAGQHTGDLTGLGDVDDVAQDARQVRRLCVPDTRTFAPPATRQAAMARPMPLPPPVTRAVLPRKSYELGIVVPGDVCET